MNVVEKSSKYFKSSLRWTFESENLQIIERKKTVILKLSSRAKSDIFVALEAILYFQKRDIVHPSVCVLLLVFFFVHRNNLSR